MAKVYSEDICIVFHIVHCHYSADEVSGTNNIPVPMWLTMKTSDAHNMQTYSVNSAAQNNLNNLPPNSMSSTSLPTATSQSRDVNISLTFTNINSRTDLELKRLSEVIVEQSPDPNLNTSRLSNTTKNIVVMMAMFIICSTVIFVCGIPNLFTSMSCKSRTILTIVSKSLFYVNGFAYASWYLLFTRKVRTVFCKAVQQCNWK